MVLGVVRVWAKAVSFPAQHSGARYSMLGVCDASRPNRDPLIRSTFERKFAYISVGMGVFRADGLPETHVCV